VTIVDNVAGILGGIKLWSCPSAELADRPAGSVRCRAQPCPEAPAHWAARAGSRKCSGTRFDSLKVATSGCQVVSSPAASAASGRLHVLGQVRRMRAAPPVRGWRRPSCALPRERFDMHASLVGKWCGTWPAQPVNRPPQAKASTIQPAAGLGRADLFVEQVGALSRKKRVTASARSNVSQSSSSPASTRASETVAWRRS